MINPIFHVIIHLVEETQSAIKVNNPFSCLKKHFKVSFSESILEHSSQIKFTILKTKLKYFAHRKLHL